MPFFGGFVNFFSHVQYGVWLLHTQAYCISGALEQTIRIGALAVGHLLLGGWELRTGVPVYMIIGCVYDDLLDLHTKTVEIASKQI